MTGKGQYEKRILRRHVGMAVVALIALAVLSSLAAAQRAPAPRAPAPRRETADRPSDTASNRQSTDRNNPEPLRVSRIQGGKEAGALRVYYYTLAVGPGAVSVHLIGSIGARDGGANVRIADVKLFDQNGNELFFLQLTTERTRTSTDGSLIAGSITNSLGVTRRLQLLLEVTLYEPTVRYQVSFDGAVELEGARLPSPPTRDPRSSSYPPGRDPRDRSPETVGANPEGPGKQNKEPDTTPTKVGEVNTEKRVALVIGNSAYKSKPLNNPINDARDMAEALRGLGFDVIQSENLTKREMEDQLRAFGKKLKTGGVGLFYYSGHGTQVKGISYLIPVGHNIEKEQDVEYEAVDASRVISEMGASENQLNIVILDACRDNPFPGSTRSSTRGLAVMTAESGTIIAYSTAPGSVASDGEGRNGLYTQSLLANIRKPGLKIEEVLKHVRVAVKEKSNGKQVPWETTALDGDFYFVKQSQKGEPGRP